MVSACWASTSGCCGQVGLTATPSSILGTCCPMRASEMSGSGPILWLGSQNEWKPAAAEARASSTSSSPSNWRPPELEKIPIFMTCPLPTGFVGHGVWRFDPAQSGSQRHHLQLNPGHPHHSRHGVHIDGRGSQRVDVRRLKTVRNGHRALSDRIVDPETATELTVL